MPGGTVLWGAAGTQDCLWAFCPHGHTQPWGSAPQGWAPHSALSGSLGWQGWLWKLGVSISGVALLPPLYDMAGWPLLGREVTAGSVWVRLPAWRAHWCPGPHLGPACILQAWSGSPRAESWHRQPPPWPPGTWDPPFRGRARRRDF